MVESDMTLENLHFFGEEVILREEKTERETDAFINSSLTSEKDFYSKFKVIKVGEQQVKLQEGDYVLVNKNGIPKEINIEGIIIKDTYSLPTHQRIFCKINE